MNETTTKINTNHYNNIISTLCGKCGRVLVKTLPSNFTTSSVQKYFCTHCNEYPISITYIYK